MKRLRKRSTKRWRRSRNAINDVNVTHALASLALLVLREHSLRRCRHLMEGAWLCGQCCPRYLAKAKMELPRKSSDPSSVSSCSMIGSCLLPSSFLAVALRPIEQTPRTGVWSVKPRTSTCFRITLVRNLPTKIALSSTLYLRAIVRTLP